MRSHAAHLHGGAQLLEAVIQLREAVVAQALHRRAVERDAVGLHPSDYIVFALTLFLAGIFQVRLLLLFEVINKMKFLLLG